MKTIKTKCSQCNGTGEVNQDRRGVDGNTCDWCCGKGYNLELMTKQKKLEKILRELPEKVLRHHLQGNPKEWKKGEAIFTQAKKEIIGLLLKPKEIEIIIALHKVFYSKPKMGCLEKVATALVTKQKERFV